MIQNFQHYRWYLQQAKQRLLMQLVMPLLLLLTTQWDVSILQGTCGLQLCWSGLELQAAKRRSRANPWYLTLGSTLRIALGGGVVVAINDEIELSNHYHLSSILLLWLKFEFIFEIKFLYWFSFSPRGFLWTMCQITQQQFSPWVPLTVLI